LAEKNEGDSDYGEKIAEMIAANLFFKEAQPILDNQSKLITAGTVRLGPGHPFDQTKTTTDNGVTSTQAKVDSY